LNGDHFHKIALSDAEAISYLKKENLTLDADYRGFVLATFEDLPLGWMNVLPGRVNNLYPSGWRIRMSS
jgi:16S rRNA (cytosine1407-C5)-methyltransferase